MSYRTPGGSSGVPGGGGLAGSMPSTYADILAALAQPQQLGLEQNLARTQRLGQSQRRDLGELTNQRGFAPGRSSIWGNQIERQMESEQQGLTDIEQRAVAERAGLAGQLGMIGLQTATAQQAADLAYQRNQETRGQANAQQLAMAQYEQQMALWNAQNQAAQQDYANRVNRDAAQQQPPPSQQQQTVAAYPQGTVQFRNRGGIDMTTGQMDPRSQAWGVGLPQPRQAAPAPGMAAPGGQQAGGGGMPGMQMGGPTQAQRGPLIGPPQPGEVTVYVPGQNGNVIWAVNPQTGYYRNTQTGQISTTPPPGAYTPQMTVDQPDYATTMETLRRSRAAG